MKLLNRSNAKLFLGFLILFYFFLLFLLPDTYHLGDMAHWRRWSTYMLENGLESIYEYGPEWKANYPPLFLYFLAGFASIQGSVENIAENIEWVRTIPLFFDLLAIYVLYRWIGEDKSGSTLPFCFLSFNIAYLYNSAVWGQVDTIPLFFVLCAFILGSKQKTLGSILCYLLALNTKLQAIIFLPLIGLLLLPAVWREKRHLFKYLGIALVLQLFLLLPFIYSGTMGLFAQLVLNPVDHYTNVSLQAYNFWYLLLGKAALWTHDPTLFAGMSYKGWGRLLFFISSFIVLLPIFIKSLIAVFSKDKNSSIKLDLFILSALLIALTFFFFNTQMHERYAHPVILLSFIYGVLRKNYLLHILCSAAYFLNMEAVLKAFRLNNYKTLIFDSYFIASLYLLVLLIGTYQLYRSHSLASSLAKLKHVYQNH